MSEEMGQKCSNSEFCPICTAANRENEDCGRSDTAANEETGNPSPCGE
jgi:hypothetical protein